MIVNSSSMFFVYLVLLLSYSPSFITSSIVNTNLDKLIAVEVNVNRMVIIGFNSSILILNHNSFRPLENGRFNFSTGCNSEDTNSTLYTCGVIGSNLSLESADGSTIIYIENAIFRATAAINETRSLRLIDFKVVYANGVRIYPSVGITVRKMLIFLAKALFEKLSRMVCILPNL
ncbi:hypothetical protein Aperf_G00000117705 [Anoplocephala perfoliata]